MELFEAIYTRRSIRKYTDESVPDEIVKKILGAAMMAPSTADARPWEFIVVTDPEKREQISGVHPYVKMITGAPLGIVVCADTGKEKFQGYWPQDCAAAMENLLLAAHACGLGAVWTGIWPEEDRVEKFRGILSLPENIIPQGLAVMGWPAETRTADDRYSDKLVHYNTW